MQPIIAKLPTVTTRCLSPQSDPEQQQEQKTEAALDQKGGAWEENDHEEEDDISAMDDEDASELSNHDSTMDNPLLQEQQQWIQAIQKTTKALGKKINSLENELSKASKMEETVQRAQLIVNNLYLFPNNHNTKEPVVVTDWDKDGAQVELILDPKYASANEEAEALFAQARKLKRGSHVIQELLEQTNAALHLLTDAERDLAGAPLEEGRLRLVQDRLRRTASQTNFQEPLSTSQQQQSSSSSQQRPTTRHQPKKPSLGSPASNVRKIISPHSGCPIYVGRNRRGNEYLSMTHARGDDVWMHARGVPGAHVVVNHRRGQPQVPLEQCFQLAANLAAFYSDARNEVSVPITVAEPKHLTKPKNAPLGAISVRQEAQVLYGRPNDVPVPLQEARAQSGQVGATDGAYRRADKAQRKKRTAAAAQKKKQQQQKNKKQQQQQQRSEDFY